MARPAVIVLTIEDAKGSQAQMLVNVINQDDEPDISKQIAMAVQHQLAIDAVTAGRIVRCGLILDISLDITLKAAPLSGSDVEEMAQFIWRSENGFTTRFNVPAFDDTKFDADAVNVDLTDPDVVTLVNSIIAGYSDGVAPREIQDSRGDDITELLSAFKEIVKPRV